MTAVIDDDGLGTLCDNCPAVANAEQADGDGDRTGDACDACPSDVNKVALGTCGCGNPDTDSDTDGILDCIDQCPVDSSKTAPGVCGCGQPDIDRDGDGTPDCTDQCPEDLSKTEPGVCGCGQSDIDRDGDGTTDCVDQCPEDLGKTEPGICGCGQPDIDRDGDGTTDCFLVGVNMPGVKYAQDLGSNEVGHFGLSSDGGEGWRPQTYHDSQGITACQRSSEQVYSGNFALKLTIHLVGGHANLAKGEVMADIQDTLTVPQTFAANLAGQTISAWVYVPPANTGEPSKPNYLQLLVKDASSTSRSLYDGSTNILPSGGWHRLDLVVDPAQAEYVQTGFDPTRIRHIGVKVGIGIGSTATMSDSIYVDGVMSPSPYVQFDFERPSLAEMDVQSLAAAGVQVIRWFVFADGRTSPEFDAQGLVTGLDNNFYRDLNALISLARDSRPPLKLIPVLFDYQICADREELNGVQLFGRRALVQNPSVTQSFLDNALGPILDTYRDAPEILWWEIINEPEWVLTELHQGHATDVSIEQMQTFVRSITSYIHQQSPNAKVTLGSASSRWLYLWTDVGLDIGQFHFYNCATCIDSGETFPPSTSSLPSGFPMGYLLGECAAKQGTTDLSPGEYLQRAMENGYIGALVWSWRARDDFSPLTEADRQQFLEAIATFQATAVNTPGTP